MDAQQEHALQHMREIADQVILTPAERGVMAEQGETMKVALNSMISHVKDGSSGDVIRDFVPLIRAMDYLGTVVSQKVNEAFVRSCEGEQ